MTVSEVESFLSRPVQAYSGFRLNGDSHGGSLRILQGQSLPSSGATGVDDPSPRLARHSFSKSMGAGALDSAGLKCSFHGFSCIL